MMRPRIALATYERAPHLAVDDQLLVPALARVGIEAEPAVWSSVDVVWETYDGVVVRSCWDYHLRIAEFHEWLQRLDASRLPTWNSPALIAWNSDKHYLLDLARRGVATIPTIVVPRGQSGDVEAIAAAEGWTNFVVKPAISASGFETHRICSPLAAPDRERIDRVVALGEALVQPFAPEVPRDGELSFVFIDGAFSHAAVKRAGAGEFRVQTEHGGTVDRANPSAELVEQVQRIVGLLPETPLYARVDGIVRNGSFLLMELELIEPNLFLDHGDRAADRLAAAIRQRIG